MPRKRAPKVEAAPDPATTPQVGDKVTLGTSETVFVVTRASSDGNDVDLNLPGTNIERFRVPTEDLKFVELSARAPIKPARPRINIEEVRERLAIARQSSIDQLSGDIAILKKYLKSKGVPSEAAEELDTLGKDNEKGWQAAVEKISELLEE
jgi:hypothetical protein